MKLLSFLGRRAIYSIFVLWGLSVVIFGISRIMPGDPARMAVGARAPQRVVDNLREQMHLNEPLSAQYFFWLRDALHGDFGISLVTRRPVADDIKEFFPATLELALISGLIMGVGGILLGILSAWYKDTWID
ncbi:MAG: ABC transporter permease, partial [Anaerolineales bacterium]|nr:ABC transporter permease [Anaerolineales bacterium]